MISFSYDPTLIVAAVAVAIMAAYTGLSLTNGLSARPDSVRRTRIVMAAVALGGGIWSTHFVAMLALDLPVRVFYDALYTLGSALIAILLSGLALILLHFGDRTARRVTVAGAVMGIGVVAMHYVGMAGMRGCMPVYGAPGFFIATALSVGMSVAALTIAYRERTRRTIILGALAYGVAIVAMHFSAMLWTDFVVMEADAFFNPVVSNGSLALFVALAAFMICGAFLLTMTTLGEQTQTPAPAPVSQQPGASPPSEPAVMPDPPAPAGAGAAHAATGAAHVRIPYEQRNVTRFVDSSDVVAIRAEGRYTILYTRAEKLFCPWSITEAEKRLEKTSFHRTHRSYLTNFDHISGLERRKDNGVCLLEGVTSLTSVPVSRSNMGAVRAALDL